MTTPPRKARTLVTLAAAGAALVGCGGGPGGGTTDPNLPPVCEQVDLYGSGDLDAQARFSDADGDKVVITTSSNLAALNDQTGTNQIALRAYAEPTRQDQQVTFSARGSDGQASATCTADPVTIPGNPEPVYTTLDVPATATAGNPVTVRWDVQDTDLDSLAVACNGCDEGRQVFTAANGSTTLTFGESGDVTFTAYDGLGAGTPQTRTVDVQRLLTQRFIASRGEHNNTRLTAADGQLELFVNGEKQSLSYEDGAWVYHGPETGEVDVRFNGTSFMPDHFFVYRTQNGKMFGERLGWTWGQADRATIDLDDDGAQYELFAWDKSFDVDLYNKAKNASNRGIDPDREFRGVCPLVDDPAGQDDGAINLAVFIADAVYAPNKEHVRNTIEAWTSELSQYSRVKLVGHEVTSVPEHEYLRVVVGDFNPPGVHGEIPDANGCMRSKLYGTPQDTQELDAWNPHVETAQSLFYHEDTYSPDPSATVAVIENTPNADTDADYTPLAKEFWSTDRVIVGEGLAGPLYLWTGY